VLKCPKKPRPSALPGYSSAECGLPRGFANFSGFLRQENIFEATMVKVFRGKKKAATSSDWAFLFFYNSIFCSR
jgi:hypothetical protein